MDFFITFPLGLAVLYWIVKARFQQQRITLLARYLSGYNIEKNIEAVTQGYLRALGEEDPARQEQVWQVLRGNERELCRQMQQVANDFAGADAAATQVSKLPLWFPFAFALAGSFDMREALRVHARGICRAIDDVGMSPKDRAFTISAELFLMQHTCHWFCRSKTVATARMAARHKTTYAQLVAGVLPQTRKDYLALVARNGGA